MQDLKNKVVLVSGAGSGIGAAMARDAARRGAKVAVSDVRRDAATAVRDDIVRNGGSAIALVLDVTSVDSWRAAADQTERELGPIDLLCSNAGVGPAMQPVLEQSIDYLHWVMEVNFFGAVYGIKCVAPRMMARRSGHILVTASVAGFASGALVSGYGASKHALIGLCESLRGEIAGTGVGLSALCPAGVATSLMDTTREVIPQAMGKQLAWSPAAESAMADATANAGGVMSAEEVARRALDGVLAGQYYIFSHLDSRAMTMARADEVRDLFDRMAAAETARR
ncbi:MAG: SDR family NAD(P)-dependent oxidoreductase [Casimicrobiaceae bacterium]